MARACLVAKIDSADVIRICIANIDIQFR
jgi:hypothetical protein